MLQYVKVRVPEYVAQMDLDDVLPDIGEFGKYQKLVVWFIILPSIFPCGFHAYNQLFMSATPEHWCRIPEFDGRISAETLKNISIPLELRDGELRYSRCLMYDRKYKNLSLAYDGDEEELRALMLKESNIQQVPCTSGWTFDRTVYAETVTAQWQLVCDKDLSATLALACLSAGGLIGNYIFGYVQDGVGRKPAFFIYLFIQCVFGIATAFASNFIMWTIFRIGVGFTVPAILGTPFVLAIELVGPKHRTLMTLLINIAYSLSLILLAIIVWAVRDWRLLTIVTTAPFLLIFLMWWWMPESPRWLLARGRFFEAEKIINTMARVNGKKLKPNYMVDLQRKLEQERTAIDNTRKYGIADLLRSSNLRWKTIILTFLFFVNTSVYVGLSYYAPALGGDEFLNFFLAGVVELPTYLFLWPSLERWGRRWALCVSMIIGGTACLATFLVQHDSMITLALYCIGKMGISSSFVVLPLMSSELFPTVVRGLGGSITSLGGMFGPIFIPLVNYLGSDMLTLPLIIMGAMLVLGGISSLLLPETLNQHLPQTLEDGEKVGLDCFVCCTPPQIYSQVETGEPQKTNHNN